MKEEHIERIKNDPIYAILGAAVSKGRTNLEVVRALIDGGVHIIQYREKEKTSRQKWEECMQIRKWTKEAGVTFLVNDSVELALACQADGIHIGQKDLPSRVVRSLVGEDMVIGVSTNTKEELDIVSKEGYADYVGFGPMYPTSTKKDANPCPTAEARKAALQFSLPVVTIGGIDKGNIRMLWNEGFRSFAMISALVGADDIGKAIKEIRKELL